MIKNMPAVRETWVRSLDLEDPLRRKWQPIPVFLPGEFHGQRSLAGYSPWGHKGLDTTEQLTRSHNGILFSYKKEQSIDTCCKWMNFETL